MFIVMKQITTYINLEHILILKKIQKVKFGIIMTNILIHFVEHIIFGQYIMTIW